MILVTVQGDILIPVEQFSLFLLYLNLALKTIKPVLKNHLYNKPS